jgi:hypothetical protein
MSMQLSEQDEQCIHTIIERWSCQLHARCTEVFNMLIHTPSSNEHAC